MKRLLLVCCLCLSGTAQAGSPDQLNGDWFILTGKNTIHSSNPDHPFVKENTDKWAKDNMEYTYLVLPNDGARVLQFVNGAWWYINSPGPLWDKKCELDKAGKATKWVAFMAQGGWASLYDKCELAHDGLPDSVRASLEAGVGQVKKAGSTLRSLAFAPDGGWVLLFGKDSRSHGLPSDLNRVLTQHRQQRIAVRCVAFNCRSDWFLLDERNEVFSNNPSHPAYRKLQEARANGEVLRLITFTPGVYTHGYVLDHQPVRRIRATLSLRFDNPDGRVDQWSVFPPHMPELARQRNIKRILEPAAITVKESGVLKQTIGLIRVSDKPNGFAVRAAYEMTLYTNRLVPRLAGQTPGKMELPADLVTAYTRTTPDMTAKLFQDFLDRGKLRRGRDESDMDFARRGFVYISRHFTYIYPNPPGVDTIEAGKGDCGALAWVFIRTMRANGVPGRMLPGRWAGTETPGKDGQPPDGLFHVKAEFFARGIGWVGVDASGGVGAAINGNPLVCFGEEGGDFVVLDLDPERVVVLFPGDEPARLGGSQGIMWWHRGTLGKAFRTEDHWTVDTLDAHPPRASFSPDWITPSTKPPPPTKPTKPIPPTKPTKPTPPSSPPSHLDQEKVPTAEKNSPAVGGETIDTEQSALWLLFGSLVSLWVLLLVVLLNRWRRSADEDEESPLDEPEESAESRSSGPANGAGYRESAESWSSGPANGAGSRESAESRSSGPANGAGYRDRDNAVVCRCSRCGTVARVLSATPATMFKCPGCGLILRLGGQANP